MMLNIHAVAKMCTRQAESCCTQELAKLASTVIPLQKLNIQEDTDTYVLSTSPEPETPTTSPKQVKNQTVWVKHVSDHASDQPIAWE